VQIAVEEANALLFMVDTDAGLTGLDKDFAEVIRRTKKPVFLVANKSDNVERMHSSAEFYELSMGDVYPISAMNGTGTGELLDELAASLPEQTEDESSDIPRIAIVGRPNAGKSSFVNALLGYDRSIATDVAGTTRDSIDAHYKAFGKEFILTDTAGIRRKSRVRENLEFYSVLRAIKSIEQADVCIVMMDAKRGVESQDLNIISLALQNKKAVIVMVNKWDLIEKDTNTARDFEKHIKGKLEPNTFIPIVFASVTEKQRIFKTIEMVINVCEIDKTPPPAYRGRYVKIKYVTQLPTHTPVFAFFCNLPTHIPLNYKRFLENTLRKNFPLEGVPISLVFRKK
jgi:GTP-binding protein